MDNKRKSQVSVIGGADGPTSVFVAGHTKKQPFKLRIKNSIYRYKRKKVERMVAAAKPHSLSETVQYAKDKYGLMELPVTDRRYIEQKKCLKQGLILQHKPELLGEMKEIPKPDISDEKSVREYLGKIEAQSKMIAEMPDNVISMNFHLYEIQIGNASLEIDIDYIWNTFGISYSGNKKAMKKFQKISKDLYLYHGVSEDDIK